MLNEELYDIGKVYSLIAKYNIDYDRRCLLDFACATHIYKLLNSSYELTAIQRNKLEAILNNLVVL